MDIDIANVRGFSFFCSCQLLLNNYSEQTQSIDSIQLVLIRMRSPISRKITPKGRTPLSVCVGVFLNKKANSAKPLSYFHITRNKHKLFQNSSFSL